MQRLGLRHPGVRGRGGFIVAHLILNVAQGREQRGIVLSAFNSLFQQPGRDLHFPLEVQGDGFR
jgi:hypothetical protein